MIPAFITASLIGGELVCLIYGIHPPILTWVGLGVRLILGILLLVSLFLGRIGFKRSTGPMWRRIVCGLLCFLMSYAGLFFFIVPAGCTIILYASFSR